MKNYTDFIVTNVDTMEDTSNLWVVFEEDAPGKSYDLCRGVLSDREAAMDFAKSLKRDTDEAIYVAKYDEYMDGNYSPIEVGYTYVIVKATYTTPECHTKIDVEDIDSYSSDLFEESYVISEARKMLIGNELEECEFYEVEVRDINGKVVRVIDVD